MDLLTALYTPEHNYLPYDGEVNYFGPVMSLQCAEHYYQLLRQEIDWQADQAVIFSRMIQTKRKVAWYADQDFQYTYSNVTKTALPWIDTLLSLKVLVEQLSGEQFNSCLLNLYHSGEEGMAWHSDAERDLKINGCIASLSFGAQRKFAFKHKRSQEKLEFDLVAGSLLLMKGETQSHWLHRLPPTKKVKDARINLTFRTIVPHQTKKTLAL
jgi:alkylated DNA repair dioxygenase AlkB